MIQTPPKSISLEDFLHLRETKPASEFIGGKIIQKPIPQGQHSRLQQKLTAEVNSITEDAQIALALPELRCTFGSRSIVPDIAVFTWERIPTNTDGTIADRFHAHPDWTIEILSPEQSVTRVTGNILHCLNYGCAVGWLVDPSEKVVLVYTPDRTPRLLENLEDILPTPAFATQIHLTLEQLFGWLKVK
jgi:Uma2 family endonuclease